MSTNLPAEVRAVDFATDLSEEDLQLYTTIAETSLQRLSECTEALEWPQRGLAERDDSLEPSASSAGPLALAWTKQLRMAMARTFGVEVLRTELLDLVHSAVVYNTSLGLLLMHQLPPSLEEPDPDASGASGPSVARGRPAAAAAAGTYGAGGRGDPGSVFPFPFAGGEPDVRILAPLGPTVADIPLAACVYGACPAVCGTAALQAVAAVTQRSSPLQLSSWLGTYSASGLTRVTEWLMEAALGWMAAPLAPEETDG
ncbi:hypothetical protein PLESTF_000471200, partial [Pleodorina starrii]